jgi:hypothetical protein
MVVGKTCSFSLPFFSKEKNQSVSGVKKTPLKRPNDYKATFKNKVGVKGTACE